MRDESKVEKEWKILVHVENDELHVIYFSILKFFVFYAIGNIFFFSVKYEYYLLCFVSRKKNNIEEQYRILRVDLALSKWYSIVYVWNNV